MITNLTTNGFGGALRSANTPYLDFIFVYIADLLNSPNRQLCLFTPIYLSIFSSLFMHHYSTLQVNEVQY